MSGWVHLDGHSRCQYAFQFIPLLKCQVRASFIYVAPSHKFASRVFKMSLTSWIWNPLRYFSVSRIYVTEQTCIQHCDITAQQCKQSTVWLQVESLGRCFCRVLHILFPTRLCFSPHHHQPHPRPLLWLQYRIGQLYMISKHSCEQSGGGEGVEVVRNESNVHPQHGPGQLTEKRIYLCR